METEMSEKSDTTTTPVKRKRRSQAQIEAEMRERIMAEVKAAQVITPETAAVMAAAAIAAVDRDINKKVNEKPNVPEERVWIVLGDSEYIRRGEGHFFGANGRGYLLKPGRKAYVPRSIVDILDHAIESIADKDDNDIIIGYRDRLRFPYSIVSPPSQE
jgi:hypothetical protein